MLLGIERLPLLNSFTKIIKLQRYRERASVKECRSRIDLLPQQNNMFVISKFLGISQNWMKGSNI